MVRSIGVIVRSSRLYFLVGGKIEKDVTINTLRNSKERDWFECLKNDGKEH